MTTTAYPTGAPQTLAIPTGTVHPAKHAGMVAWFKLGHGITVTGAGVSQWDDVSGNGNHLLQATDTNRPSKEADGSILFDGVDNELKTATFTLNQPTTVYFLGKQITWTNGDRLYDGINSNTGILFQTNSTPIVKLHSGLTATDGVSPTLNTYVVITSIFNSGSSVLQLNNDAPKTGDVGTNNMAGFTLGASGGGSGWGNIQVKEVIIYNEAHDATTRAKVIAYLNGL